MNNSICLEFITKCNWECPYCIAGTRKFEKLETKEILNERFNKMINYINKLENEEIVISGGEPGLLGKEKIKTLLKTIIHAKQNEYYLNTNGTFFQTLKKLPEDYLEMARGIVYRYHMLPTLEEFWKYKEKIVNNLFIIKELKLKCEFQVLFTKFDSIDDCIFIINWFNHLVRKLDIDAKLICAPAGVHLKNGFAKDIAFTKKDSLKLLKFQKALYTFLNESNIELDGETHKAFDEILGFKEVRYKTHEALNL